MHLHRSSALGYASATSALHSRVYGACSAEAAASEASGLSVGGCIRACRDFRPYPVTRFERENMCGSHEFRERERGGRDRAGERAASTVL